jgi:hypothetical protein
MVGRHRWKGYLMFWPVRARSALSACGLPLLFLVTGQAVLAQERGTKVVPEQPARVFVMAGFDTACRALAPVQITVDQLPSQGSVSLREGQETTIQYSVSGTCIGARIAGTGIYYTARPGASGSDTFSISARLGSGAPVTRAFTVRIAED